MKVGFACLAASRLPLGRATEQPSPTTSTLSGLCRSIYLLRNLRRTKEKPLVTTTGTATVRAELPRFLTPDSAAACASCSCHTSTYAQVNKCVPYPHTTCHTHPHTICCRIDTQDTTCHTPRPLAHPFASHTCSSRCKNAQTASLATHTHTHTHLQANLAALDALTIFQFSTLLELRQVKRLVVR